MLKQSAIFIYFQTTRTTNKMAMNLNLSFVMSVLMLSLMFQQLIVETRNLNSEPMGPEIHMSRRNFVKLHKRVK